jgi:hypothetical protein
VLAQTGQDVEFDIVLDITVPAPVCEVMTIISSSEQSRPPVLRSIASRSQWIRHPFQCLLDGRIGLFAAKDGHISKPRRIFSPADLLPCLASGVSEVPTLRYQGRVALSCEANSRKSSESGIIDGTWQPASISAC